MAKSAQAFRTIREVADWLGVAAHVLRFWESKFSQIKPVKRAGGRRYYRPSDMELVGGIKVLLHDRGMTIRGVKKMISDEGLDAITALSPPIDSLLEDADVIDITPDQEWEKDAAADASSDAEEAPEEAASDPAESETNDIAAQRASVDEEPAPEAAPAPEPASAPSEPEAEATPTPEVLASPPPAAASLPHSTGTAPRADSALTQLAQFAREPEALTPHLPALKALRDKMGEAARQQ
ncbi:MerR family transcriptional regulator [Gymnodinialimonas hymeniacidonis]|uniref:MerR family transcriptional regulator n=1 Tax=Gymnodinialimonas hymeniacidonis TaxID=3126508 RepID=UPI0034C5EAB3